MPERRSIRDPAIVVVKIDRPLRRWVQSRLDLTGETPGEYLNRLIFEESFQFGPDAWKAVRQAAGDAGPRKRAGMYLGLSVIALGAVAVLLIVGCESRSTPPRFEVQRIELGAFPPGRAKTQVDIANAGDEPLVIERVLSDCGSVRVCKFPVQLDDGATGAVALELDVVPGSWGADLLVVSNDRCGPHRLRLAYRGTDP